MKLFHVNRTNVKLSSQVIAAFIVCFVTHKSRFKPKLVAVVTGFTYHGDLVWNLLCNLLAK
jgi:hypothetical protein